MMVRLRERSPLARTRSPEEVASSSKPCDWNSRVQSFGRAGFVRFFRSSTRIFFFFDIFHKVEGSAAGWVRLLRFRLPPSAFRLLFAPCTYASPDHAAIRRLP